MAEARIVAGKYGDFKTPGYVESSLKLIHPIELGGESSGRVEVVYPQQPAGISEVDKTCSPIYKTSMHKCSTCDQERRDIYLDETYWNGLLKMALSRFFILQVLSSGPEHGYVIAKRISELTQGCCSPSQAAIYPVLKDFMHGGYVTCHEETVSGRKRKVYSLTLKGRQALRVAVEAWRETSRALNLVQEENEELSSRSTI
ncbi:MAG: helix-turn-helix transcriptional regulator [Desulfovermiculus sp.]